MTKEQMKTIRQKLEDLVALGKIKEVQWFALNQAKSVAHLTTDPRVTKALRVTEAYILGSATVEELREASAAAAYAAYAAAYAADVAAVIAKQHAELYALLTDNTKGEI